MHMYYLHTIRYTRYKSFIVYVNKTNCINMADNEVKNPGFTGIGYPEVFTTKPPQPTTKKAGQIPDAKVDEYFEQGFTIVEDFFSNEELEPVRDSYKQLIDGIANRLYETGRIKNLYKEYDMKERLLKLDNEWSGAAMMLIKLGKLTPEFRNLYGNEKLLNAIEQLIGPNISAHPIWNTRPKLPGVTETDVPWHQDSAYFDNDSYSTLVATAWVAFYDTTVENGCLEFVKNGHKKGMVINHDCCDNFYLMLFEEEMVKRLGVDPKTDFQMCPMKAGSVIFFSNVIPHRSNPNTTDKIRWGMDLRYQKTGTPWGFYGMKSGIVLRDPDQPDLVPDWDAYDSQDRYVKQKEYEIEKTGDGKVDEFDTTISGPWMEKWQIVRHSVHVDQFLKDEAKKAQESN